MKTQKATTIYGSYQYEIAIGENGMMFSRTFTNGKTQRWETVPSDLKDTATRNMPKQPAPYKARLPLE